MFFAKGLLRSALNCSDRMRYNFNRIPTGFMRKRGSGDAGGAKCAIQLHFSLESISLSLFLFFIGRENLFELFLRF